MGQKYCLGPGHYINMPNHGTHVPVDLKGFTCTNYPTYHKQWTGSLCLIQNIFWNQFNQVVTKYEICFFFFLK